MLELVKKGRRPFLTKEFSLRPARPCAQAPTNTLWPDISRRVCRGQFRWAEASAKYFSRRTRPTEVPLGGAAAKNGLNLIRGLRAANSARLFWQSVKRPPAAGAGFLSGKTIRFGRKYCSSLSFCRSVTPTKNLTRKLHYFIDSLCFSAIF